MASATSVLWIDDDEQLVGQLLTRLARLEPPIEFHTAHQTEAGHAAIRAGGFDVAIIDLEVGASGIETGSELITAIARQHPSVEIIVYSGFDDLKTIAHCSKLGASDFVAKSSDAKELHFRIQKAVERRLQRLQRLAESTERKVRGVFLSRVMVDLHKRVLKLGETPQVNVLIRGETGAGKDVIARQINDAGEAGRPYVAINCAAVPESLLETTFFGHEKGAFTGADTTRIGKIEIAHGGDLFLDEVATLTLAMQAKLLRVLETKEFERLGSNRERVSDFRVISATNENLESLISDGKFRQDLYERLAGYEIHVPPLRERLDEILPLAKFFLKDLGHSHLTFTGECEKILTSYPWPGNVRQLKQVVQVMAALADGNILTPAMLPKKIMDQVSCADLSTKAGGAGSASSNGLNFDQPWQAVEDNVFRLYIDFASKKLGPKASIRSLATVSGIPRSTLADRLRLLGLSADAG